MDPVFFFHLCIMRDRIFRSWFKYTCCKLFSSVYPKKPSLGSGICTPEEFIEEEGVKNTGVAELCSELRFDMVETDRNLHHDCVHSTNVAIRCGPKVGGQLVTSLFRI